MAGETPGLRRRVVTNNRRYTVSAAMRTVLAAVVDADSAGPPWGLSLCEGTGLGTAAVYVALDRLMKAGLIRDEWETPLPADRPARRYYYPACPPAWYRENRLLPEPPGPELRA